MRSAAACFDKHVLETLWKTRVFKVSCQQCGEVLRESEVDQRLSGTGRREVNIMKFYASLAETEGGVRIEEAKDEEQQREDEEYVMVEKEGAPMEMNGGWKGANKKKPSKGGACVMM
ncbi:hypothetical protein BST61_g1440 [Cercospora zeina]